MEIATNKQHWNLSPDYDVPVFVPHPLLRGAHAQTLASHFLRRRDVLPAAERRLFRVEPEVQVLCLCNWQPQRERALTLVLVHGLEGSCESPYMVGTAYKALRSGMNVVRMNVRNCGGTEGLGPTLYHSGLSADIGEVVRAVIAEDRLERLALAGFSMGGNQVLKLVGEWGRDQAMPPQVRAAATVSPAMDLAASAVALHESGNRAYEYYFLLSLRQRLRRKVRLFPARYHVRRWWWRSIADFDNTVTAGHFGYRDAAEYYERASAARVLEHIAVPTLILYAKDDPMVRITPETRAKIAANDWLRLIETEQGGHCAFLSSASDGFDGRWAERQIIEFVSRVSAACD